MQTTSSGHWLCRLVGARLMQAALHKSAATLLVSAFLVQPVAIAFADEELVGGEGGVPPAETLPTPPAELTLDEPAENTPAEPAPATGEPATSESDATAEDDAITEEKALEELEEPLEPEALLSEEETSALFLTRNADKQNHQLRPDEMSGALRYTFNLTIPPGRNGVQPQLNLEYSSQDRSTNSIFAQGWKIDIPYIQRVNKTGAENLYASTTNFFYSSVSGELATTSTPGSFFPRSDDGSFIKYEFANNQWTATDKQGTAYKYGHASSTRQDSASTTDNVYKWMLEEVRDTNGNTIRYEYFKDRGQIYPQTIFYTGTSTDGIFQIDFSRAARADVSTTSDPGFSVTTRYVINQIQAKVGGQAVRTYALGYGTGDNGAKALLTSITESGTTEQGAVTTLPPVEFKYSTSTRAFVQDNAYDIPTYFVRSGGDYGTRILDINGDGYPDILRAYKDTDGETKAVYLNDHDGTGWTLYASTTIPEFFYHSGEPGVRFVDINGDTYLDLVRAYLSTDASIKKAYLNNGDGTGWAATSSTTTIPEYFWDGGGDTGVRFADVNGDGHVDMLRSSKNSDGEWKGVYLNNGDGTGWTQANSYTIPVWFKHASFGGDIGIRLLDVNADGLADIVQGYSGTEGQVGQKVYLNKGDGTGWAEEPSWTVPHAIITAGWKDMGVRFFDINADGLVDFVRSYQNIDEGVVKKVYLNTGSNFVETLDYTLPELFVQSNQDLGYLFDDVNADGAADLVRSYINPGCGPNPCIEKRVYINASDVPDLLTDIRYPQGGDTEIAYQSSAEYKDGAGNLLNPIAKIVVPTVATTTQNSGFGPTEVKTYQYGDGSFYSQNRLDRRFAGFNSIAERDNDNFTRVRFFHQGNGSDSTKGEYQDSYCKIGREYRTEIRDAENDLFALAVNKWDKHDLESGRCFVKAAQSTELDYDGDSDHLDKAASYAYDNATGNLTQKIAWGSVTASDDGTFSDVGTDLASTTITYAASSTGYLSGLPASSLTHEQSANKVRETRHYYDNLALGSVSKGNETKREQWIASSTYASTTKAYDSTGVVTEERDPNSNLTTYTLDQFKLYPATSTNALGHTTGVVYDYSSGKVQRTYDPNGRLHITAYDGLDRGLAALEPDPQTGVLATTTTYTYTDLGTSGATSVLETRHLNAATSSHAYTYMDGLGRKLQERTEGEGANTYAVRDWKYDDRGLLQSESLPYFAAGTDRAAATGVSSLYTTYAYDPLDRMTLATNALGSTAVAYDQWSATTTDALGKKKEHGKDAHGNLVRVAEHLATSTFVTAYEWDRNKNLTKITDALGNVRSFTYDGLARLTAAEDLHAVADGTFGAYSYTYDDAGNLTSRTDPKAQVVEWTYDALNRSLTENFTGAGGTEVTYGYDACVDGVGRLCTATTTGAVTSYTYSPTGLVASERKTIDGSPYTTAFVYDRLGNITELTYPDGAIVRYGYDDAGLLDTVARKAANAAVFESAISELQYAPTGAIALKRFANDVTSSYTHDATKLYRLTNILTYASSTIGGGTPALTYGNEYEFDTGTLAAVRLLKLDTDKFAVCWGDQADGTDEGECRVGMVSGSTISFGATSTFATDLTDPSTYWSACDAATNKIAVVYANDVNTDEGEVRAAIVSGSTIGTWGTAQDISGTHDLEEFDCANIASDKIAVSYNNEGNSDTGEAVVITFSSTTPTIGAINDWATTDHHPEKVSVAKLGANKFITCAEDTDADQGICYASTVSGTTITHGALATIVNDDIHESIGIAYMDDDKFILTYSDETTDNTNVRAGTVSSTTITLGTVQAIDDEDAWDPRVVRHDATHALHVRADLPGTTTPQGVSNYVTANYGATSTVSLGSDYTFRSPTIDFEGVNGLDAVAVDTDAFVICYVDSGDTSDGACKVANWELVGATTTPIGILQNVSYAYDAVGNITTLSDHSETGAGKTIAFGYDDLHRLTSASTTAASSTPFVQTFAYNAIGSLTSKSDIGSYTYAGTGTANPHAPTTIAGVAYAYDDNGNLTSAGEWTYGWNYRNRLLSAGSGVGTSTFAYDHMDQRVKKTAAGVDTLYPNKYVEVRGASTTANIWMGEELVATIAGDGAATSTQYVHPDHLNSAAVTTNASGTVASLRDYYPYGTERISSGELSRTFLSQVGDDETNLQYLQARYYAADRGQFLSQDPVHLAIADPRRLQTISRQSQEHFLSDPQLLNSYAYGRGNPMRYKDPEGKEAYGIHFNIGAEGGLGVFAASNLSIGLVYVRNPETGQASFAVPVSVGTNSGVFGSYQSYPTADQLPTAVGVYGGAGFAASYSPNARSVEDLLGVQNSFNVNIPAGSVSVQGAGTDNPTYMAGPGVKGLASVSSYPVQTSVPFSVSTQTIQSRVNMAATQATNVFQSAVANIQAQISSIRSQLQTFTSGQSSSSSSGKKQ